VLLHVMAALVQHSGYCLSASGVGLRLRVAWGVHLPGHSIFLEGWLSHVYSDIISVALGRVCAIEYPAQEGVFSTSLFYFLHCLVILD
jgi:hypothetical protein